MGLLSPSPSDQRVLLAMVVPAELAYRSGPLNSCLYDPEGEWVGRPTAGAAEHMQREGGEQETKRREGQPILTHPSSPSGPLHCHPPLSKPPLLNPPGCKFLVCSPNTKVLNSSKSQAEQVTDSHTWPPVFLQNAPSYWSHNTPGFI